MQNAKNMFGNIKGSAILSFAALLWGLAFVAQSAVANIIPPFFLNGIRSLIGSLFLLGFLTLQAMGKKQPLFPTGKAERKRLLLVGLLCGVLLAVSVNFQQFGLTLYPEEAPSEARGGFITALYVILVPLFAVFTKRKPSALVWLSALIALGGVFLLCFSGNFIGIYTGDILMLCCALSFTFHVLSVDRFGGGFSGAMLCMIQFFFCGILSLLFSAITGEFSSVTGDALTQGLPAILYLGIVSSGIAYTLQIVGQKFAEPAIASLSMSLESVFAALGGWVIRKSRLSFREIVGCLLVFLAIVMAQIPDLTAKGKNSGDKGKKFQKSLDKSSSP